MPPQTPNQYQRPQITPTEPVISTEPNPQKEGLKSIISTVMLFILAPLFALFMILFVFQSYVVDGSSMEPTLQNGNRVFILKLPKTVSALKGDVFIPTRHEIIVFKKPSDPSTQLIKRVIGLPGERVVVKDGVMTVYSQDFPEGFDPDKNTDYGPNLEASSGEVDITLGANELFVSGDNRAPGGSLDSRTGLGVVPAENIIGRLWIRYFPLSEFSVYAILQPLINR